ncbi:gamma-glutamylcyclotransferase family protein [Thiococcus pfennigii]|uniref:gamma-glutamylcyclotransferase family protein n=1 Tax=Thiococcus pfennigii TaxID=1057 RepID=UPI00190717EA|nr:gamma-glutamylcyclotransferase family protein [Thiococcus pfennigii]MBK1702003.1 gamma-glutamylcyclotransferase [Thiococcus pfennigii]MBK1733478.1 gamma-glutamylcyclotransferase [Thiococcus pfennigii]
MEHRVFVYGTLRRGEVNHRLLADAEFLGGHRTEPCFALYDLGAYPGLTRGGRTAVVGEVYRVDTAGLRRLDRLEDYPRLYTRTPIASPWGPAWIYCYRGRIQDRPLIRSGDWRALTSVPGSFRAAAIRRARDPKTRLSWRDRGRVREGGREPFGRVATMTDHSED